MSESEILGRVITRVLNPVDPTTAVAPTTKQTRQAVRAKPVRAVSDDVRRWPYAGFAPMTRIRTTFGDVPAAALRKGDLVKLASGDFKPIVWLDRLVLDEQFLAGMEDAQPVLIGKGAIGRGLPQAPVKLSPRQILPRQGQVDEAREAADLVHRPHVRRAVEDAISYTLFHVGETAEVICEGMRVRIEV